MPYTVNFKLNVSEKAKKQGDYLAEKTGPVMRERIGQAFVDRVLDDLTQGVRKSPEELAQFAEELIAKEYKQLKAAETDPERAAALTAKYERVAQKIAKADRVATKAERAASKARKEERAGKVGAGKGT